MTELLLSQWEEVCGRVRATEEAFFHDPWLDRISFVSSADDTVVLATPNRLYVEFIQENLEPLLLAHLGELTGETYSIDYKLDASLESSRVASVEPIVGPSTPTTSRSSSHEAPGRFHPNPRKTFSSFIVGGGNQFAAAAAQNVADFPAQNYNPLFIFGGVGLGKTHLVILRYLEKILFFEFLGLQLQGQTLQRHLQQMIACLWNLKELQLKIFV